jgi:hypothetical protein
VRHWALEGFWQGTPVRYIRSAFAVKTDARACSKQAVSRCKATDDEAKLPYSRVIEALDVTP